MALHETTAVLEGPATWLDLDRAALLHNLAGVRALVGSTQIMAVLKANAYGAGAPGMARVLAETGVTIFGVASVTEGVQLRQAGISGTILCLTYFTRDEVDPILEHSLTASLFTIEAGQLLASRATAAGRRAPIWVKVDTGLGRLGVPFQAAPDLIRALGKMAGLKIVGLFSTLTENPERDPLQVQRLLDVRRAVPELTGISLSLASSHGIVSLPASTLDVVRPGILLHGLEPSERERMDLRLVARADLQPITTWKARVGFIRTVAPGEQIGYGSRPALRDATRSATLTVGWAAGYSAEMSNGGAVLIQGRRCPVMAVSANSTLVDLGGAPEIATNSEAVLLGKQGDAEITAAEMALLTGGSVYRLLASVPHDVPRVWR
jgi:alanine racemase